jgi:hypothetical protein
MRFTIEPINTAPRGTGQISLKFVITDNRENRQSRTFDTRKEAEHSLINLYKVQSDDSWVTIYRDLFQVEHYFRG